MRRSGSICVVAIALFTSVGLARQAPADGPYKVLRTARVGGEVYAERVLVDGARQTHAMGFWTVQLGLSWYLPGSRDDR